MKIDNDKHSRETFTIVIITSGVSKYSARLTTTAMSNGIRRWYPLILVLLLSVLWCCESMSLMYVYDFFMYTYHFFNNIPLVGRLLQNS